MACTPAAVLSLVCHSFPPHTSTPDRHPHRRLSETRASRPSLYDTDLFPPHHHVLSVHLNDVIPDRCCSLLLFSACFWRWREKRGENEKEARVVHEVLRVRLDELAKLMLFSLRGKGEMER